MSSFLITNMVPCTDLGLRRSPDGPDTVQSITRFHFLLLLHLTRANNPIPSAEFKLTVCKESEEMWRRGKTEKKERGKRQRRQEVHERSEKEKKIVEKPREREKTKRR